MVAWVKVHSTNVNIYEQVMPRPTPYCRAPKPGKLIEQFPISLAIHQESFTMMAVSFYP